MSLRRQSEVCTYIKLKDQGSHTSPAAGREIPRHETFRNPGLHSSSSGLGSKRDGKAAFELQAPPVAQPLLEPRSLFPSANVPSPLLRNCN